MATSSPTGALNPHARASVDLFDKQVWRGLPLKQIASQLHVVSTSSVGSDTPIVSVGSGHGFFEAALTLTWATPSSDRTAADEATQLKAGRKRWILVDPAPQAYLKPDEDAIEQHLTKRADALKSFRTPDFATVDALLASRPELQGRCLLVLCWSDPNHSRYDWCAIQALDPVACLVLYDAVGGSSGFLVHHWLRALGCPAQFMTDKELELLAVVKPDLATRKAWAAQERSMSDTWEGGDANDPTFLRELAEARKHDAEFDKTMRSLDERSNHEKTTTAGDLAAASRRAVSDFTMHSCWSIGTRNYAPRGRLCKPTAALILSKSRAADILEGAAERVPDAPVGVHTVEGGEDVPATHVHEPDGCCIC
jgi:hypothetical protein